MDDLILRSYLDDFAKRFELARLPRPAQFEHFVNYCAVARDYQGHFDTEEISTGLASGIDGIAIFVNDILVSSPEEVNSLVRTNRIDVKFLFVQAKTSAKFDLGQMLKFTRGVREFFGSADKASDYDLGAWHNMKRAIYAHAIKFDDNPKLQMVFATAGAWHADPLLVKAMDEEVKLLRETNLFSEVTFQPFDADRLKTLYRSLSNKISKQITFEKNTVLPKIAGVKRAFIGILPCSEYLKLITDDNGRLLRNVFYDNVRDYQGENAVNREVITTLTGDEHGDEIFVLLNNGVTIVAKSINPVGNEFMIRDFQVVNGCQTSHILHKNVELLSGKEFITIKLIETDDSELTNKVTKATNRQTEVKLEAFAGLLPFHKELEAFFASFPVQQRLYYERRPGQYDFDEAVMPTRIISIPSQIKAFVSVFLEEPHQVHFYYGQLLEDYSSGDNSKLFNDEHDTFPYYAASWLAFLVYEKLKRRTGGDKKWRFHLAMMIRLLAAGPFVKSRLNDKNYCKRHCDAVLAAVIDEAFFNNLLEKSTQILRVALDSLVLNPRDHTQSAELTEKILLLCTQEYYSDKAEPKLGLIPAAEVDFDGYYVGSVKVIVKNRFGFISYGAREFYFKLGGVEVARGERVRFKIRTFREKSEAYDVHTL